MRNAGSHYELLQISCADFERLVARRVLDLAKLQGVELFGAWPPVGLIKRDEKSMSWPTRTSDKFESELNLRNLEPRVGR